MVSALTGRAALSVTESGASALEHAAGISSRELDLVRASRDTVSAVTLASSLRSRKHDVIVLSGQQAGIITDNQHSDARILEIDPTRILESLAKGQIVVVMGCQGVTKSGELTRLGFGTSDTTAALIGTALGADCVEIFTDVEGIMTADPRIVLNARCRTRATYAEIYNLAYHGANVIHPLSVKIAMQRSIPIRVRRVESPTAGTLICCTAGDMERVTWDSQCITGITQVSNIAQISLERPPADNVNVLSLLQRRGVDVDYISMERDCLTFTIQNSSKDVAIAVLAEHGFAPTTISDCARVSMVGTGITNDPGTIARVVSTLASHGIRILLSGNAYNAIWCLVEQRDMERAVRALHQEFETELCSL